MTERHRGFARGDFDTAFPLDDKFMQLRAMGPERYYAAAGVYWHVVAAAWRRAERKPAALACPDAPDGIADLVSTGLLDRQGKLPVKAYDFWIGRALTSRRAETERKARNRTGMSRGTPSDIRVTARDPREGGNSSSSSLVEGGVGGTTPGPVADADDPYQAYMDVRRALTYPDPQGPVGRWIDRLADRFGGPSTARAIRAAAATSTDPKGPLREAESILLREARAAETAERVQETARVARNQQRSTSAQLLVSRHNLGQHADSPADGCPYCVVAA